MAEKRKRDGGQRWGLLAGMALAGASTGVIAATATTSAGWERAVWGAAGGATGLAGATVTGRYFERRAVRTAASSRRSRLLAPVVTELDNGGGPFGVLLATSQVADFRGRRAELAKLAGWRDDPGAPRIAVVTGPGGTGKSRLVTHFAAESPSWWFAGWLEPGCGRDAVAAAQACGEATLILVDDAESRPDVIALLEAVAGSQDGSAVRVILIGRTAGLAGRLASAMTDRHRSAAAAALEIPLGALGSADDRARWYTEAARAYARALHTPPPDLPPGLDGRWFDPAEPILTVHARALLDVLESRQARPQATTDPRHPFDHVAEGLFWHEQYRWQQDRSAVPGLSSPDQAQAIGALLLASPASHSEAVAVLRLVPEMADAPAERLANIARWAVSVYPGDPQWPLQIKPDMLAEWFLVRQLTQTRDLNHIIASLSTDAAAAALITLAHASDHSAEAAELFTAVAASDPCRLVAHAAAAAATVGPARTLLDAELADLIEHAVWTANALGEVEAQLSRELRRSCAAAAQVRVKLTRADGTAARLAASVTVLGARLRDLGRYREARPVEEEAVRLFRALAANDPGYRGDLANSLTNLGSSLGHLGRHQRARVVEREAIRLLRALAANDAAYRGDLANSLNYLGACLRDLGHHREAKAAIEEAIVLCRALAADDPARQGDLASSLTNLGVSLADLGRHQEAQAAEEEAIGLYRALAANDPAYRGDLANSLNNLGNNLRSLGRHKEAWAAGDEAVGLFQVLAADDPGYGGALASALI